MDEKKKICLAWGFSFCVSLYFIYIFFFGQSNLRFVCAQVFSFFSFFFKVNMYIVFLFCFFSLSWEINVRMNVKVKRSIPFYNTPTDRSTSHFNESN